MKVINKKYGIGEDPKNYLLMDVEAPCLVPMLLFIIGLTSF
jgi:hypothetical protein